MSGTQARKELVPVKCAKWMLVGVLAVGLASFALAQKLPRLTGPAKAAPGKVTVEPELALVGPVPSAVWAKLRQPLRRATLVESLLSRAQTRAVLEGAANQRGLKGEQLKALSLTKRDVAGAVAGLPPVGGRGKARPYEELDWEAGIRFTPNVPGPLFSGARRDYRAGAISGHKVSVTPSLGLPELSRRDALLLHRNLAAQEARGPMVVLRVELPPEPATYMFAVHVAATDGRSLADYVGDASPDSVFSHYAYDAVAEIAEEAEVELTVLSDGSGLVGLRHITPYDPLQTREASSLGWDIRGYNCLVCFSVDPAGGDGPRGYLLFGGFTITRL